ncbi:WD domain repeat-containing protein 55 [Perkinsus olseni]|uniref:WD domain repeat-containing protein 55 n=3 Tax=Perkinsus olseni TaxID=32597 RepID=A0A7J6P859_PEROL|nr:WD domain repeat-containing protein 55 [Perkinsus olseni]
MPPTSLPPLPDLILPEHTFDVRFHPAEQLLASATISGDVIFHTYDQESRVVEKAGHFHTHRQSCRVVRWQPTQGDWIMSGSADGTVSQNDRSGKQLWLSSKMNAGVSTMEVINDTGLVAAGSDEGQILVFDPRIHGKKSTVVKFPDEDLQEDYITQLLVENDGKSLLSTSGDATLGCYDLRYNKQKLKAMSDNQENELLSMCLVKDSKKLLTGDQNGVVGIWNYDYWGDVKDRITHMQNVTSLDNMIALDDSTVVCGGGDGYVRVFCVFPNAVRGVLGGHTDASTGKPLAAEIESMHADLDEGLVATVGQDYHVKFWRVQDALKMAAGETKDSDIESEDDEELKKMTRAKRQKLKRKAAQVGKQKNTASVNAKKANTKAFFP